MKLADAGAICRLAEVIAAPGAKPNVEISLSATPRRHGRVVEQRTSPEERIGLTDKTGDPPLMVHFELLQQPLEVREILRSHGWRLDASHADSVSASHPEVHDEAVARNRLHTMGLLTSRWVRITFGYSGLPRVTGPWGNDGETKAAPTSAPGAGRDRRRRS